jgi:twitching motility protein PilT
VAVSAAEIPSASATGHLPAVNLPDQLTGYIRECLRAGASDIHLTPGIPPCLRIEGELRSIAKTSVLTAEQTVAMSAALLSVTGRDGEQDPMKAKGSVDGAFSAYNGSRFRFNIFRRQGQIALVLRLLEERFRTLGELGFPESLYKLCDLRDGLVVVAGATGAGKSTTLAALIDRINRTRSAHIITIEDPIEYIHKPIRSVVNQRQIGMDAPLFNDALVSSLRQDPDVILVGEIRDLETIRTAIIAAETGHLVFTTLHAGDCVSSLERLVGVFPANEQDGIRRQLSLVLRAVVAQHLLPQALPENERNNPLAVRRRVVASEVLMMTPAVANLTAIARTAQIYSSMEAGQMHGMQTLEQDLARLWSSGKISEAVAVATARNVPVLRDRVASLARGRAGSGALK